MSSDEIIFICNSSLKFIGQNIDKGIKRVFTFDNIKNIEIEIDKHSKNNRTLIIFNLKEGIKKDKKTQFQVSFKKCFQFLVVLNAIYKIYTIKNMVKKKN